jgi:hypothetical protein
MRNRKKVDSVKNFFISFFFGKNNYPVKIKNDIFLPICGPKIDFSKRHLNHTYFFAVFRLFWARKRNKHFLKQLFYQLD